MIQKQIKLSKEFKKQAVKAISSILFFCLIYTIIFLLAIGLTILCVYLGLKIIMVNFMLITLILGIGMASLGVIILLFLLKFIFKPQRTDRSHLTEIKRKNEPELFALIDEIVLEVGTNSPKKVYLSADVSASVFYDSTFWSMFFPVKKNLQIGLALVNIITRTELKAVLSHEFGHFSQKTMKIGSYVHNLNQIIFNLLYENQSFDKMIQRWSNTSSVFFVFCFFAVKITEGIQWILRILYNILNKNNLALSREMEFHADEIAANVTGYQPLENSLLRMPLIEDCFNSVLNFYDDKISKNIVSENIYKEQLFVTNFIAKNSHIEIQNQLPTITIEDINKFNKSKLVIKDQWTSHPSIEDRINRLHKTSKKIKQSINIPANNIFKDIDRTQKKITSKLFEAIKYELETTTMSLDEFINEYSNDYQKNMFSDIYQGYYDNKNPLSFDINKNIITTDNLSFNSLFTHHKLDLIYNELSLKNDVEHLKLIHNKTIRIKSFDYDGKKYKSKEAKQLFIKLELILQDINNEIKQNDIQVFQYFNQLDIQQKTYPTLKNIYIKFFEFDKYYDLKLELCNKIYKELEFVNFTTPANTITNNFTILKSSELALKKDIQALTEDVRYQKEINDEMKENFELYLSKEWTYFGNEAYFDDNLNMLFMAIQNYTHLLSRAYFLLKQDLLNYQENLHLNTNIHY